MVAEAAPRARTAIGAPGTRPGLTLPPLSPLVALVGVLVTVLVMVLTPALGAVPPVAAQAADDDGSSPSEGAIQILGVDRAGSDLVLDLAVPPSIGRLAPTTDNFEVADGGQLVDFTVTPLGTAADIILVIDTSGSMRGPALSAATSAATSFLEEVASDARVGLISFGDTVVTHREPTLERDGLLDDLAALEATGQETVLWDALLVADEVLGIAASADPQAGTGARSSSIVVLSDGDDTASAAGLAEVVQTLGTGDATLYAVAIESPDTNLAGLEAAVDGIGGQFLATADVGQLQSLYTDIAGRLANRYQLRFSPVLDGERTVVVAVATAEGAATARITVAASPVTSGEEAGAETPGAGPPAVLNVGDQPTLGLVPTPPPGLLGRAEGLWIGLGSLFVAIALAASVILRPRAPVRINAAANVDRIEGVNLRLGQLVDRLVSRHDRGGRIDRWLEAADINVRPGEFLLAVVLIVGGLATLAGATIGVSAGVAAAVTVLVVVILVVRVRTGRRRARFADQLTETLGIMASSLRAGQSLPRSIELVAAEAPSPTAEQFHRMAFEIRVGRDITESIREAAERMDSPDLAWLAQAVDINRVLGGDLTEILDNVAATIRERRSVARQVDALSAEGRATGWVLLVMPVLLFALSWWRTPEQVERLLTATQGQVLLAVAALGMVIGHLWIRKLVKVQY